MTPAGRQALRTLHDVALRKVVLRPDPFDLALVGSHLTSGTRLRGAVTDRRNALAVQEAELRHRRDFADPYLSEAERKVLAHLIERLRVEIRWHDEVLADLPLIVADFERRRTERQQEDQ